MSSCKHSKPWQAYRELKGAMSADYSNRYMTVHAEIWGCRVRIFGLRASP